jgi:hypothetical protein
MRTSKVSAKSGRNSTPRPDSNQVTEFRKPLFCKRFVVVPGAGLEPACPFGRRILSPATEPSPRVVIVHNRPLSRVFTTPHKRPTATSDQSSQIEPAKYQQGQPAFMTVPTRFMERGRPTAKTAKTCRSGGRHQCDRVCVRGVEVEEGGDTRSDQGTEAG